MGNQEKESSSPKPNTPRPTDSNPYPTTFVQADTTSFKQVVQMLTGSAETAAAAASPSPSPNPPNAKNPNPIPPKANGPKKQAFKLYERRNSLKSLSTIGPLTSFQHHHPATAFSPRKQQPEILSPSILDFPSLVLSPVTPLIKDPFGRASMAAEEKAIAEKGFYLHPSPRGSNKDAEPPRLLPLFPVTSPRASTSE